MPCKHRKALYLIGGAIACGGIAYALLRRRSAAEPADTETAEFSQKTHIPDSTEQYVPSQTVEAVVAPAAPSDSTRVFPGTGASITLPPHWKIAEDISPVPNVAMISMQNEHYSQADGPGQMPGSSPVLVLSVEDNAQEGLDLEEFKEKSKQTAMQQMYMMTNGMVPPQILFDGAQDNGVFEMVLEYGLQTPMFQMRVINFITMRDDLAYVIQFMGNAEVFAAEIDGVREIVRNFAILPLPEAGPVSKNVLCDAAVGYQVALPVNWVIDSREPETVAGCTRIVLLSTATPVKTERVELFKSASGALTEKSLRAIAETDKAANMAFYAPTEKNAKTIASRKYADLFGAGISVLEYDNIAAHKVLLFALNDFCIRVTPLRCQHTIIKPRAIAAAMQSFSAEATESGARYISGHNGFSFPIKERSRVVESRIGDNTVTFAPEGIQPELLESINNMKPNEQTFEPTPIFTIRCGDPSTDKDCETDLEGWMARLRAERSRADVKMNDLCYEEFNGRQCISFTQKEMQESAPGKKDEHQAKIFVFVNEGKTFMLRWETPTEVWKKFEPKLHRLLDGFVFANAQE